MRTVRTPRGPGRTRPGWPREAARRLPLNSLDPEVAAALQRLTGEETLPGQSGKPAGVRINVCQLTAGNRLYISSQGIPPVRDNLSIRSLTVAVPSSGAP